jgi:hypothetical protein
VYLYLAALPNCPSGATVEQGDPNATTYSYTDSSWSAGQTYFVTTVDIGPSGATRESTPARQYQAPLTLIAASPLTHNTSESLSASGGTTGGAATYYLLSGPCSLTGNQLTANSDTGSCVVTATMAGNSSYDPVTSAPVTVSLQGMTATGFYPPVATSTSNTPVWNAVKGGSTVPLKFNIYAGGVQQTSPAAVKGGTVSVGLVACSNAGSVSYTTDYLQNTGATALRYDTTAGQFIQNWKVPKRAGVCYTAVMTAADNVTTLQAYFKTN